MDPACQWELCHSLWASLVLPQPHVTVLLPVPPAFLFPEWRPALFLPSFCVCSSYTQNLPFPVVTSQVPSSQGPK